MCTKLFTKPAYMLVAFLYYNALNLSPKFSKCPVEHDPSTRALYTRIIKGFACTIAFSKQKFRAFLRCVGYYTVWATYTIVKYCLGRFITSSKLLIYSFNPSI